MKLHILVDTDTKEVEVREEIECGETTMEEEDDDFYLDGEVSVSDGNHSFSTDSDNTLKVII